MAYGRARDVFTRQTSCMEARMRWKEGAEEMMMMMMMMRRLLGSFYSKTVVSTRQGSLDIRSKLQVPRTTASSLIHLSPIPLQSIDGLAPKVGSGSRTDLACGSGGSFSRTVADCCRQVPYKGRGGPVEPATIAKVEHRSTDSRNPLLIQAALASF